MTDRMPKAQWKVKQGEDELTFFQQDDESFEQLEARVREAKEKGFKDTPQQARTSNNRAIETHNGEKSFQVESVKLASGGDHPRWVVKGKPFTKFGVTCWPETLEAAGMMPHLDPLKENKPQAAWTAFYTEKLNDEGKAVPDKVTRLVKA